MVNCCAEHLTALLWLSGSNCAIPASYLTFSEQVQVGNRRFRPNLDRATVEERLSSVASPGCIVYPSDDDDDEGQQDDVPLPPVRQTTLAYQKSE